MLRLRTIVLFCLPLLFIGAGPAQAVVIFQAVLTHDQEVISPPIPDEGSGGTATFILNDAGTRLTYDIQLFGLDLRAVDPATGIPGLAIPGDLNPDDNAIRLHIHRAVAGVNGPIVFGMIDAVLAMRNDTSPPNGLGNPADLLIDIAGLHITGAWDLPEGVPGVATLATELDDLFRGELYVNVHTTDHAGGEIRGQILVVPEPATLALLGLGLGLLGLTGLRRRVA